MGFPDRIDRTVEHEAAFRDEFDGHSEGWVKDLGELADCFDAA